jgi:hypothetical protein
VCVRNTIGTARQANDSSKHVQKRDEIENDAGVDEELIGAARGVVDLADEQNRS